MLKLYTIDFGWEGALVVVANSKEEAFEEILKCYLGKDLKDANSIQEHEITSGLIVEFLGDQ